MGSFNSHSFTGVSWNLIDTLKSDLFKNLRPSKATLIAVPQSYTLSAIPGFNLRIKIEDMAMASSTPLDSLKNRLPMEWLRERDVDLLICSELHSAGALRNLFLAGWNGEAPIFGGAWVSHHDPDGESDIVVEFKGAPGSLVLLIENKIGAEFQPDQPERYRDRALRWQGLLPSVTLVETVLLAPEEYFENEGSELFDRQISYEDVIAALAESDDSRTQFLAETLKNGVESHRRNYSPLPNEVTTSVWAAIWECANAEAPQLRMRKPGSKPARAGFIYFESAAGASTAETQRRAVIVYKPAHENVDLQFSNMAASTLEQAVTSLLEPDMAVAQADKSASIRIKVPSVDFGRYPEGQQEAIRQGISAAERLRQFFIEKRPLDCLSP